MRRITFTEDRMHGCHCLWTHYVSNPRRCKSVLLGRYSANGMMHEHIQHNLLEFGQVCGVADRRDHDHGTTKKASAKRDRRKTKRPKAGGGTVKKSCDTCSIKKRRCDGGRPCSRCVSRGAGHKCTYSTRRPYTSRRNRPSPLWSSSTSSPGQTAEEVAPATSGSSCRKCSMGSDCRDVKDQQITRHQPLSPPAVSGYKENIPDNSSSVVEASPPPDDGLTETPKSKCSSVAINEEYPELALAQQGVMSLIVSTNSLSLQAINNGPYQQTAMKQHPVPCCELDEACDIGVGYAEMMPRTVLLDGQNNQKSGDIPGLEIGCPVPASPAALVKDVSIEDDDGISSTLDLDVNILPSCWSDDGATVVHHVPVICFDQQLLLRTSENIADITTAADDDETLVATKSKSFSALELGEREIISAEDWFQFAATL